MGSRTIKFNRIESPTSVLRRLLAACEETKEYRESSGGFQATIFIRTVDATIDYLAERDD